MVAGGNEMIDTQGLPPDTVRKIGLEILNRELGPDGMIEFLQQFSLGAGDYSKERAGFHEMQNSETLLNQILEFQKSTEEQ
jgi:hypothetical protein